MAAVSQPGSRAGLITALVISVVLFMVAAALWVVNMNEAGKKTTELDGLKKKYVSVITESELPAVRDEIEQLKSEPSNRNRSYYDILRGQRDDLSKRITGRPTSAAKAIQDADATVAKALQELGKQNTNITSPTAPLSGIVATLAGAIIDQQRQMQMMDAQIQELNKQLAARDAARVKESDAQLKAVEAAKTDAAEAIKDRDVYKQTKDTQIASLEDNLKTQIASDRKLIEDLTTQLKAKSDEADRKDKELKKMIEKMDVFRPRNLSSASIRRADGHIIQLGKNNVAYINLGQGQQISPGMTFEVYDKNEGVPTTEGPEDQLPTGKGSLEVVRVSPGSSECRIIHTQPGQQIVDGDIIANLIYDPNVKWSFKVYGDYDIDQNGAATSAEADIIKRLVALWGGKLTDQINLDTDFLVMGKEPVLPNYTAEQRKENPLLDFEYRKAEQALKAYDDTRAAALELHIPVLNQNRFLYLIGYYEQAQK